MSKREQQKKIKEQKQKAANQRERMKKMCFKVAMFGVTPLLVLFAIYTLFNQGPTYSPVEIADNDHIRGQGNNPVSVVVYADFQCPACATEHEDIIRVWPDIRDKAFLVFRHFPITTAHPHSWTASLYAEAAGLQGRFWEMHDTLFATQQIWSSLADPEGQLDAYALELNLNIDKLHEDMARDEVIAKLRSDQRGGSAAGVRGTPALFINGRQLARPSRQRIVEAVEEEYADLSGG